MTNEADHTFSHMLLMSSLREMRHDIGPARQGSTPNIKWQQILLTLPVIVFRLLLCLKIVSSLG